MEFDLKNLQSAKELDGQQEIILGLLNVIHQNSRVSQRNLALELNVALGLVNSYLKRCIRKGWVKVANAPANRYLYYLTPSGVAEKSILTAEYLSQSFHLYRLARDQYAEILNNCYLQGNLRIALFGGPDLSEIVSICTQSIPVEIIGVVCTANPEEYSGHLSLNSSITELADIDVFIITDLAEPQIAYDNLLRVVDREKIVAPAFLDICEPRTVDPGIDNG